MTPRECLTWKETQIAILVWEGLTNREISKIVGTTEQVIKNHLRSAFDKPASGAGWSWRCTWRAMEETTGQRVRSGGTAMMLPSARQLRQRRAAAAQPFFGKDVL
jgi:hypothetical protein